MGDLNRPSPHRNCSGKTPPASGSCHGHSQTKLEQQFLNRKAATAPLQSHSVMSWLVMYVVPHVTWLGLHLYSFKKWQFLLLKTDVNILRLSLAFCCFSASYQFIVICQYLMRWSWDEQFRIRLWSNVSPEMAIKSRWSVLKCLVS